MALIPFFELLENLKRFDVHAEILDIVERNGERIVELQQEQMAAGIDKTGEFRRDEYRPFTIEQKRLYGQGLGAETDRVTFYMTGEMYSLMENVVEDDVFQVRANTFKFDKMLERVGDDRYGLDEVSRKKFAEEITLPQFAEALLDKTSIEI